MVRGNPRLQFLEPVEDDVDLGGGPAIVRDRLEHQKPFAVGRDVEFCPPDRGAGPEGKALRRPGMEGRLPLDPRYQHPRNGIEEQLPSVG